MAIQGIGTSIVMGIVEGLTEFLPISSTGHLIITGEFLRFNGEFAKLFDVFIQLGAILSVVWIYREKIFALIIKVPSDKQAQRFCINLSVAFFPAALTGLVTHKFIKQYLFGPLTVSGALVAGGILIIIIENMKHSNNIQEMDNITFKIALMVGLSQILALFPGVSRSGATIMGGILAGMSRKASTEFSFFLAIPTMFAATLFDLSKNYSLLTINNAGILAVGFVAAFFSALLAVRWLLGFISTHDFKPFAYYRMVAGIVLLYVFLH